MGRQAKAVFHGFENLGSAAVEDEAANVHAQVVVSEKVLDGVAKLFVDDLRDVRGEDNVEAAVI